MLTNSQIELFRENGFLKSGRVLEDSEIEELLSELDRVIAEEGQENVPQPRIINNLGAFHGSADTPVWQIVNIWEASPAFTRLTHNPTIVEEIAQLTAAEELRVWHDQIQYKPASKGGVNPWHQDAPKWRVLQPKTQVSAWVALDDVDQENGCMSMVKGSHLFGDCTQFLATLKDKFHELPEEFDGHPIEVALCPVRKGEVHYHHGMTWHGSHANHSDRPRRAIAIHYMTGETVYDSKGDHALDYLIDEADGERIANHHFPLVWRREKQAV